MTLRELEGDIDELESRLQKIKIDGVPNYFGEQRFGHDGNNINVAEEIFRGQKKLKRHQRGIYLSAARSYVFNKVLSKRVEADSWNQAIAGDVMQLTGSHSCFLAEDITGEILQRIKEKDICPTGPMWGRGQLMPQGIVAQDEVRIVESFNMLSEGLEQAGMNQERRPLGLFVDDLEWDSGKKGSLELLFTLPAGSYATSVLRELINYK